MSETPEINGKIDEINTTSLDMPLQMVSISTGKQTRHNISTEHILCGLRNKIKAYLHKAKKTGYLLLKQDP